MKTIYNYANIPVSKSLEALTDKKLNRFNKFFKGDVTVNVFFKKEGKDHSMKMVAIADRNEYTVLAKSNDMYKNIDRCLDKLKRQITTAKKAYRTDSKKISRKVNFHNKYDLEQEIEV